MVDWDVGARQVADFRAKQTYHGARTPVSPLAAPAVTAACLLTSKKGLVQLLLLRTPLNGLLEKGTDQLSDTFVQVPRHEAGLGGVMDPDMVRYEGRDRSGP